MKTLLISFCVLVALCATYACGSSWTISDNKIIVTPIRNDTVMIVPAGSTILTPEL